MERPRKLSYANVMVTLLAFVVLGGGVAYAADHLAKNSVGPKQLRKNSVTGVKVKDGSLRTADFAPNQLPAGPQGPAGSRGPNGTNGTNGTNGANGANGTAGTSHLYQASGSVNFDKFSSSLFGSQVVSLQVPPGSYFATSAVSVQTVNATPSSVTCRLINGDGGAGSTATIRNQIARADGEVDNMTLAGGFQISAGQSLKLECSKSIPASGARINAANIVAFEVSSVSGLPE